MMMTMSMTSRALLRAGAAATLASSSSATATTNQSAAAAATVQTRLFSGSSVASAGTPAPLSADRLVVQKTANPKPKPANKTLEFGKTFTDHMLLCEWDNEEGWAAPRIVEYGDLSLSPAVNGLHYGMQCFEGMKAYKDLAGSVRLFRPDMNMSRMNDSSARLQLPRFDAVEMQKLISELVRLDSDWVPQEKGYSLYIRPTHIGTARSLGVRPTTRSLHYTILSPVGPYYPVGFKPVKLYAHESYVRAWPGGTGCYKVGGNYAPGILPQLEVGKEGFDQILWLFGPDYQLTEVGTMNAFVFWVNEKGERELVTPPLTDGTILPGVTRDSVLALTRSWGEFNVAERALPMADVLKARESGRLLEVFGVGTACVVSPVCAIHFKGTTYDIPLDKDNKDALAGPLAQRLSDEILAIQYGEKEHEWSVKI